jgi:hypothetical protein
VTKPLTAAQKAKRAAVARARYATPEGRAARVAAGRKWMATPEGKATRTAAARKCSTPEGKARARAKRLMAVYGLTPEQYDLILAAQGGRCAICRCIPRARRLAVDHCHQSRTKGRLQDVRGLLCQRCNHHLLGAAHDKPEILDRAAAYLRHPPAPSALYAEEGMT